MNIMEYIYFIKEIDFIVFFENMDNSLYMYFVELFLKFDCIKYFFWYVLLYF